MIKNLIITVLGKATGYSEVNYKFENKIKKNFLASTFFKECIGINKTHQLIFLPHTFVDNIEEIELLLSDKNYSVELLPALVEDRAGKFKSFNFNANYGSVLYLIFLKLIHFYLNNFSLENLYVDISVGLNIYIDALKEASRSFKVFSDLIKFTDPEKINFRLLFSDPVIGSKIEEIPYFKIFTEPINTKIWFDSPIKMNELNESELSSIGLNKNQINLVKDFYYTFFSIYRNAPLLITTFGYKKKEFILNELKEFIEREINQFEVKDNTINIGSYQLPNNIKLRQAFILSLALYYNISQELENLNVPDAGKGMISFSVIKKFLKIFERYKLNSNKELLERDLKKLEEEGESLVPGSIKRIADIEGKTVKKIIYKRNFYAHSGFEANITFLGKTSQGLTIGYDSEYRDKLKSFILQ